MDKYYREHFIKFVIDLGTECLYSPQPPIGSNIEQILEKDSDKQSLNPITKQIPTEIVHKHTYKFDATIFYRCIGKTKFSHDYNQMNVSATCLNGNNWIVPNYWGNCVPCKFKVYMISMIRDFPIMRVSLNFHYKRYDYTCLCL